MKITICKVCHDPFNQLQDDDEDTCLECLGAQDAPVEKGEES